MQPYVSLDIETTGRDPERHQILEIALVVEDPHADPLPPVADLDYIHRVVRHEEIVGEPYALMLNAALLKEIAVGESVSFEVAMRDARVFLMEHFGVRKGQTHAAGKNVQGFDLRFLPSYVRAMFHYRTIDVGSVLLDWRSGPESMGDLLLTRGMGDCTHRALEDARDNIRLLRTTYGRAT